MRVTRLPELSVNAAAVAAAAAAAALFETIKRLMSPIRCAFTRMHFVAKDNIMQYYNHNEMKIV